MKITTTIKLDSIKDTTFILLDKKTKIRYLLTIIFSILLGIISLIINNNICLILSIILLALNISSLIFLVKAKEEVATKAFNKIYPLKEYILEANFKKDKIEFANNHFSKKITINYEDINKLKQTKNYIIMILNNKQHFLFNKQDIDLEKLKERISRVKK